MLVKTTQVMAAVNLPPLKKKEKAPPLQKQDLMS